MQLLQMRQEAKSVEQPNKSVIMVAMQVRNKYMGDFAPPHFIFHHLDLGAFATIYQIVGAILAYYLAGRVAVESGYCGVVA